MMPSECLGSGCGHEKHTVWEAHMVSICWFYMQSVETCEYWVCRDRTGGISSKATLFIAPFLCDNSEMLNEILQSPSRVGLS